MGFAIMAHYLNPIAIQANCGVAKMNVPERVIKTISNVLGLDVTEIKEEMNFVDDLGVDSLDHVELIMAFEDDFEIEVTDEDAETVHTVLDAIKFVNRKL